MVKPRGSGQGLRGFSFKPLMLKPLARSLILDYSVSVLAVPGTLFTLLEALL